ncbi:IST1-like protein [Senna tora]|uniref:IST1-like protein n=1 Tax=Senna tora TaxID=362788 RepID=A0A834SS24_9FABA|nr:IST1-like protein [Senna tora]
MGKKLDALFGRGFKASKFKPQVSLAISRLAVLKHQRQVRSKQARSDVLELLKLGHHERALLRAEQVVKEQNLLDVYDKIEGYCNLLIERVHLIEQERECPEELREAASGLVYAASRCGDFPELQEIRAALTTRFGKEFAARAVDLRNNCGVHLQMIQKLSTRMPSLESRMKALKEIASENSIVLQLDEASPVLVEETSNAKTQNQTESERREKENLHVLSNGGKDDKLSDSLETRQKYKDVADAAQAAFESAAYAAAAARAAVELSRSESHDPPPDDDDHNSPSLGPRRKVLDSMEDKKIIRENHCGEFNKSDNEEAVNVKEAAQVDAHPLKEEIGFDESENEADYYCKSNQSFEHISSKNHDGIEGGSVPTDPILKIVSGSKMQSTPFLDLEKKPLSVRTRRLRGY